MSLSRSFPSPGNLAPKAFECRAARPWALQTTALAGRCRPAKRRVPDICQIFARVTDANREELEGVLLDDQQLATLD